ncbi:MAG: cation diffusion facilitator family transporter [Dokdonella sp.]|uniref:cation diffusion facilitator family transporter n=1 Tax=Dokdonella sp. TaxID=2291710 RepID=UPI0032662DF8
MAKQASESRTVVIIALVGNAGIACAKFIAASVTGSSAMLSEGVHSLADTANELLLLHGLKRASAPATIEHPYGHGREVYFWSFIVALLIFALGAGVSFYQGVHRLLTPEPVSHVWANFAVLGVSFFFEGISWTAALRRVKRTKGKLGYLAAIRSSKDPTVFTVLLEDTAALLGLIVAFAGIGLAAATGRPEFDAAASIVIALVLCVTSFLLARETKGLLIGESALPQVQQSLMRIAREHPAIAQLNGVITTQLGPDHVLAALSAEFEDALTSPDIEACVEELEIAFKKSHPEIVSVFIKPQKHSVWAARKAKLGGSNDATTDPQRDHVPMGGTT